MQDLGRAAREQFMIIRTPHWALRVCAASRSGSFEYVHTGNGYQGVLCDLGCHESRTCMCKAERLPSASGVAQQHRSAQIRSL